MESIKDFTLYHTIRTFNYPVKRRLRKHCGKRRKCCLPAFSPFPTMFSSLSRTNFRFFISFILLSANTFNLDEYKMLSFDKELNPFPHNHFLMRLGKKSFGNIVGKGEIACTSNFSFSHNVFYSFSHNVFYSTLLKTEIIIFVTFNFFSHNVFYSTLLKTEIIIFVTFNLSSANTFNLGLVQNFVVWEWVNPLPDDKF